MRPRLQFSLQGLMAAVAAVAVLLSVGQLAGGEATFLAAGLMAAVLVSAVLWQSKDAAFVPAGLCGMLICWLIAFPLLAVDHRQPVDLWDGALVVAVLWEILAYRGAARGASQPFDYRQKSREAAGTTPSFTARLVKLLAMAALAGGLVLLACAGYVAAGDSFRSEAERAWVLIEPGFWHDPPGLHIAPPQTVWRFVWNVWPVIALGILGIAAAVRVRFTPPGPGRDIVLRHVAIAHVLGLLMLALTILRALLASFAVMSHPPPAVHHFFHVLYTLAASMPPVLILSAVSFLALGAGATRYLREHGWLLALGIGAVALAVAVFVGAGVVMYPELR